jgi:outer membrane protein assembly factor BamB
LVGRGLAIVRSGDFRVTAFDSSTGRRRWSYSRTLPPLTVRVDSEMVFAGDLIVGGFPGGRLVALTSAGIVRWDGAVSDPRGATEVERLNDVIGAPWVAPGDVCAASFQGRIACFDAVSGSQRWARDLSAGSGVGGDARNVYVASDRSALAAFARSGGASVWRQTKLENRRLSTPIALRRAIAAGDLQGWVHLLSPDSGELIGRVSVDSSAITVGPRPLGAGAVVQTQDGTVALIEIDN